MAKSKGVMRSVMLGLALLSAPLHAGEDAMSSDEKPKVEIATFGGGCFWCVEAVFEKVPGVLEVVSGYQGGKVKHPTYEQVSRGNTGHAEVTRITYDPAVVSYERLLEVFWLAHDPTQLNQQGADVGTQYRSVIFYHDEEQRRLAEASKAALAESGRFSKPIVTEISAAPVFYPAEGYHQDYYRRNPNAPYSTYVIREKMDKLKRLGVVPEQPR
ncbi:MAG TPA: peptide-methionine (S)-S-oxide reductase MsrA [Kiritimatiellia bacterium]|nr:peptide-methionine (S)-S-oxide reductase MsrA [Kiritimatiellia bacterium]HMP00630.1 peptide-methionine (S)-S-oxide reductase MsrA [Kiritimatiellia bacterium]